MGYSKIIQSGVLAELFTYTKPYVQKNKGSYRRTRKLIRKGVTSTNQRTERSVKRAKTSFYRLVLSNLYRETPPTFVTLTNYKQVSINEGYEALRGFQKRLKQVYGDITSISVPEWQKTSGFLHFHCLVWGIPKEDAIRERNRRFLQGLWARGYVDTRVAHDKSPAIAGYMAKYMQKAMYDSRLRNRRAYSSTHNVFRPYSAGGNALATYKDYIVGDNYVLEKESSYATLYLGDCIYQRFKLKENDTKT